MDRAAWIIERKRLSEKRMDTEWAPVYDENWGAIDSTHEQLLKRFLSLCPAASTILDAACGTGIYCPLILSAGHTVFGLDRSQGMLDHARLKFPHIPLEKISYYPKIEQVKDWLRQPGFHSVDETTGEDCYHFLVQNG